MSALTDPLRGRILLVLERQELTVNELCAVFQLPQSTMSRHLKTLTDDGWLKFRAEGTSRRYSMAGEQITAEIRRLWKLVRDQVVSMPAADQDNERVRSVLAERRSKSQEFFSTAVGEWDRLRRELIGRRLDLLGLLGLVDDRWAVGDLGCGTGQVTESLAPFVREVVAIDDSAAMLAAARDRLSQFDNVSVRSGYLEKLPLDDMSLDAVVVFLVLHHVSEPGAAFREIARVLRPGGRMLLIDMTPHDREDYRQRMGHIWLGFGSEQLAGWAGNAGLEGFRFVPLPADPDARGPTLFAATARTPSAEVWIPGMLE
jgi:SAM-dependent methyltransferase